MNVRYHSYVIAGRPSFAGSRRAFFQNPRMAVPASAPTHAGSLNLCQPASSHAKPDEEADREPEQPRARVAEQEPREGRALDLDVLGVRLVPKAEQD